jgi:hypothetical protein
MWRFVVNLFPYLQANWPELAPVLTRLALSPAATAQLESKFSVVNWLASPRRSRMSPDLLDHLAVLACNKLLMHTHVDAAVRRAVGV